MRSPAPSVFRARTGQNSCGASRRKVRMQSRHCDEQLRRSYRVVAFGDCFASARRSQHLLMFEIQIAFATSSRTSERRQRSCAVRPEREGVLRSDMILSERRLLDGQSHSGALLKRANPQSRDSPMRNCASEVWSFGPSRNDRYAVTSSPSHTPDPAGQTPDRLEWSPGSCNNPTDTCSPPAP